VQCVCFLPATLIAPPAPAQEVATDPPAGLDLFVPRPATAIATADAIALGRILFFDPLLSRDRSVACATCHRPDLAFTDGRVVPRGVAGRAGHRNVPTLINRAWGRSFFRDGRALSLEAQVLEPIHSPAEMDMPLPEVLARLERSPRHARAFRSVFGRAPTETDLARALAARRSS
jgi:cytochrome c peroxidase